MDPNLKNDEIDLEEDEIDLRKYLLVLARRWQIIRDTVIVAVIGALLYSVYVMVLGPSYEATAGVALIKSKTTVNFENQIKTISPDTAAASTALAAAAQDAKTRRSTLASLVKN
ncbi:MAG: Wzz/FepE/Etk N-terminal domain-containing protein, partial [Dehalococcoidia bacterium]|nr:Wzz/FepE/Etk N-terminal domain-containing protein [Dehalococcoidia bacterium]